MSCARKYQGGNRKNQMCGVNFLQRARNFYRRPGVLKLSCPSDPGEQDAVGRGGEIRVLAAAVSVTRSAATGRYEFQARRALKRSRM